MAPNLEFRLTGGSTNTDPSLSLGDITSNNTPVKTTQNNFYYDSTPDETSDGTGDYICLDIVNNGSGVSPASDVEIYTSDSKEYSSLRIAIGLNDSPMTRNRKTPPSSLLFEEYTYGVPLGIPDISTGETVRIWVERLIHRHSQRVDDEKYDLTVGWMGGNTSTVSTSWKIIEGNTSYNSTNLIDHTQYEFLNRSNLNIAEREIDGNDVLDVPVFPPQNIVIDDERVNIYNTPQSHQGHYHSFIFDGQIYALFDLDTDQRMAFLTYGDGFRDLIYRFGGIEYPQDRIGPAFAITSEGLLMWGGQDSKSVDRRELWHYKVKESTWYDLHPHRDTDLNLFPSMRYESNLVEQDGAIYLFGGKTYTSFTHSDIVLNDFWYKAKGSEQWVQFDNEAKLPHTSGYIVYVSSSVVKLIADNQLWTIPTDGTVPMSEAYSSTAIIPDSNTYTFTPDSGEVHYVQNSKVYKWDNSTETMSVVRTDCGGIGHHPVDYEFFIQEGVDKVRRGDDSVYQHYTEIYHPRIKSVATGLDAIDCTLNAVPVADYMATCDVGEHKKFLGLGMIQDGDDEIWVEDHWIWDGETLNTTRVPKVGITPQERLEANACWDEKRNRVWLFGGYSGSHYYNDLWYLDLTTLTWTRVRDQIRKTIDSDGVEFHPQARAKAGMVVVEDSLWIVAGYSDQRSFADMWEYYINTDEAVRVQLNDWVPFGTDYEMFNWRDRMWLFNGENRTLYRYFYDFRLWQPVLLYSTRQDKDEGNKLKAFDDYRNGKSLVFQYNTNMQLKTNVTLYLPENLDPDDWGKESDTELKEKYLALRNDQHTSVDNPALKLLERNAFGQVIDPRASVFMLSPIRLTVKGNKLVITYNEVNTIEGDRESRIESMLIDMDSKEVMPLPGNISRGIFWVNAAKSMAEDGQLYYYNISSFELAQKNQLPYFDYATDPLSYEFGMTYSSCLMEYYDPDTVGGVEERFCYFDKENMYVIYQDDITYTPLIPTNEVMKGGLWGEYWCHTDYSVQGTPIEPVFSKETVDHLIAENYLIEKTPVYPDYVGAVIKTRERDDDNPEGVYYEYRVHNHRYRSNWRDYPEDQQHRYKDYEEPQDLIGWLTPVGHDWQEQNVERHAKNDESFREVPRMAWKRVPKGAMNFIANAQLHWKDEELNKIYSVNSKTGSIHRTSVRSRTSLTYPTRVWKEGSYANSATCVYAFGGSMIGTDFKSQNGAKPQWFTDIMKAVSMGMYRGRSSRWGKNEYNQTYVLDSHDGFMKYDLTNVNLQLRMLSGRENDDIKDKDYDSVRDYLISIAQKMGIDYTHDLDDDWLEEISNTMYDSTIGAAGDMATRFFANEDGDRPFGPRVAAASVSRGGEIYIFGGCYKYYIVRKRKDGIVVRINYKTSFPYQFEFNDDRATYKYHKTWKYGDSYVFDSNLNKWTKLADMPAAIFGATATLQPDQKIIWIVGGYIGNTSKLNHDIYKFHIDENRWEKVEPLPVSYKGRGMPNCAWLDDHRMMILFGFNCRLDHGGGRAIRRPWADCWILDKTKGLMYKMFENTGKTAACIHNLSPSDDPLIDMMDFLDPLFSTSYAHFGIGTTAAKINQFASDMQDKPDEDLVYLPDYIPVKWDKDLGRRFYWNKVDSYDGAIKEVIRVDIHPEIADYFSPGIIVDIFRDDFIGDVWILCNHYDEEKPALSRGLEIYRLSKVNDFRYTMDYLAIDKPGGNQPAQLTAYLGKGKVLVVYNEVNIYELDLRLAAYNPNGDYWKFMPPEPELMYMDIFSSSGSPFTFTSGLQKQLIRDGVIRFYYADGSIVRYDRSSLLWKEDRGTQWSTKVYPEVLQDGPELNYYRRGDTDGRIFNLDTMQTDKFYYDAELLYPDMQFPTLSTELRDAHAMINRYYRGYVDVFGNCRGQSCFVVMSKVTDFLSSSRSVIKRGRIYTWNENNHLMRAWTRKHANVDLEFTFSDYYKIERVDFSVDYDTLEQASRFTVEVNTEDGWKTLNTQAAQETSGWDWNPTNRNYRKQIMIPDGYTYVENTRPGYYVRAEMTDAHYVKGVRVKFFPKAEEWNYIARINHIYIVSEENSLSFQSTDGNPLAVTYIAPFDGEDSDTYTVQVKNNHPLYPASNINVYLKDNYRIYLSVDNINWVRATKDDRLQVAERLSPSTSATFYMRAKNSLDKSSLDLLIDGDFPLET